MTNTKGMPTWDQVLNINATREINLSFRDRDDIQATASKIGYPYFRFNGEIYSTMSGECTKWTPEMLNKKQNGKKAWFTVGTTTLNSMVILTLCLAFVNVFGTANIPWFWVFFPLMMGPLFILTILAILLIVAIGCFIAVLFGK